MTDRMPDPPTCPHCGHLLCERCKAECCVCGHPSADDVPDRVEPVGGILAL